MKAEDKQIKHAGGRPTKYYPEISIKIEEYIATTGRENTSLPTVEGLSLYLGISKDTLYRWTEDHPEFSDAIKRILAQQKKQLMDDGMYGGKEVNSAMAIFLLKVNHGMKENEPTSLTQINVEKGNEITFVSFKDESTS